MKTQDRTDEQDRMGGRRIDRRLVAIPVLLALVIGLAIGSLGIETKGLPDEPGWLANIHKVLPGWDPTEDTPIPDWAKPDWAVGPHGRPTEVSLRGPYTDDVEWLNASYVFSGMKDWTGAVYIDHVNGVCYTLQNITSCPDKDIVDFMLANKDKVGSAVGEPGEEPEDDIPGSIPGGME